jgi:hypothetical protein
MVPHAASIGLLRRFAPGIFGWAIQIGFYFGLV